MTDFLWWLLYGLVFVASQAAVPSSQPSLQPTTAPSQQSAGSIVLGGYHTCALLVAKGMMCWGRNTFGQLGDGSSTSRYTPVFVTVVSDVTAMALGQSFTCALLSVGTVSCWGVNNVGQLGDGSSVSRVS
eukprot:gene25477-31794_t